MQVVRQQLQCAAAELPLHLKEDELFFGAALSERAEELKAEGLLGRSPVNPTVDVALQYIGAEVRERGREGVNEREGER